MREILHKICEYEVVLDETTVTILDIVAQRELVADANFTKFATETNSFRLGRRHR